MSHEPESPRPDPRSPRQIRDDVDEEIRFHLEMRAAALEAEGMDPCGGVRGARCVASAIARRRRREAIGSDLRLERQRATSRVSRRGGAGSRPRHSTAAHAARSSRSQRLLTLAGQDRREHGDLRRGRSRPVAGTPLPRRRTRDDGVESDRASNETRRQALAGESPGVEGTLHELRVGWASSSRRDSSSRVRGHRAGGGVVRVRRLLRRARRHAEDRSLVPARGVPRGRGAGRPHLVTGCGSADSPPIRRSWGARSSWITQAATIVGVLPPDLEYPGSKDLWAPKRFRADEPMDHRSELHGRGRPPPDPGVSVAAARVDLARVASELGGRASADQPRTSAPSWCRSRIRCSGACGRRCWRCSARSDSCC